MISRNVTLKLKTNSVQEFRQLIDEQIVPLLRKQNGFRDEITFVAPGRSEAVGISFWETKADAEAYNRIGYPEVLKTLSKVVEGTPKVETFEVTSSTFHKIAAKGL
jgi:hypothetical protein